MTGFAYDQIANHMRVCVAIKDDDDDFMCAIASSEPILSEAASRIMLSENLPFSLQGAFRWCWAGIASIKKNVES
jgi:hypothetical protein